MKCPICKSTENANLYRLCDNMKIMGPSFPQTPAFVAKCKTCGLLYMNTEATQQDFLSYYKYGAVAPKYNEMFGKEATEDYYRHLETLIQPYMNKKSRILDIAGAWGEFAEFMQDLGYEDITVLDPNEKCITNAKELGVKTITTDSTDMDTVAADSFDMVILNHSLEHVLDVETTMDNIARVLVDGGYLFIEVPDVEGYADEEAAPFNFLTYEHVLHMSMHDLENLAGKFGYEIVDKDHYYKKVSNYPSVYVVLKKGSTKTDVAYSDKAEKAFLKYIEKSEKTLEQFLRPLRESKEPLILWGIGASTAILIESFRGCKVVALIDKNPARQGLVFSVDERKYSIEAPETVGDGTIVILSIPYHDSIARQIRDMGLTNKIVALKQE